MTTTSPRAPGSPAASRAADGRVAGAGAADRGRLRGVGGRPRPGHRRAAGAAAHRRPGGAVRRGGGQRPEVLVAGRRAASRHRGRLRRGAGPRRRRRSSAGSPQHATTRVGPRGGQVQVPVEVLEAVTVRHYTSRAGDPHRHLHLQINARVFAAGKWRGLHTVGVRDFLAAINGIGHAAVAMRPAVPGRARRARLHPGLRLEKYWQLADYVGPFSARAAQIGRNIDRYEREWTRGAPRRTARARRCGGPGTPGRGPRAARTRSSPQPGADLDGRWLAELAALGYRDRDQPVAPDADPGRRAGPGQRGRPGAGPAGRRPLGVERRRHPRRGRAADRRRGHRRRRRRCASSWPRTSPPAPWPGACRCWTATGCPSTSGPGPRGRCSTSRPT